MASSGLPVNTFSLLCSAHDIGVFGVKCALCCISLSKTPATALLVARRRQEVPLYMCLHRVTWTQLHLTTTRSQFSALHTLNSRQTKLLKFPVYTSLPPASLCVFMLSVSLGLDPTWIWRNHCVRDIVEDQTFSFSFGLVWEMLR